MLLKQIIYEFEDMLKEIDFNTPDPAERGRELRRFFIEVLKIRPERIFKI